MTQILEKTVDQTSTVSQIGEFVVSSNKLIVSDPCYEKGTWCSGLIAPVKNGTWRATIEITDEGRALTAKCEEPVGEMEEAPFEVGVDSAQAGIFCDSLYPSPENPNREFYERCCEATQTSPESAGIVMGRGVVANSQDDGSYSAFVGQDEKGAAVAVRIKFY